MAKYYYIGCHVLWREICYYTSLSENYFDFKFLDWGLHRDPDKLRREIQKAIDENEKSYDAILIGYGLCSNGTVGIKAGKTKLVIVRGHDCITHLLGSKERYREYFDNHPGTYWYSPGWIEDHSAPGKERYENTLKAYKEKYGEDNAEYLMEMEQQWFKEYSKAAYVDLGISDNIKYKEYTRECAKYLKWNYDEIKGDPKLLLDLLGGNWDENAFLIVEPGQKIAASHDERVIKIEGAK